MKINRRNIPDGMRDMIFSETKVIREVGELLYDLYSKRGYGEVMTPGVEYYDIFRSENQIIPEENMYKLTDASGRLVVLRPDNTAPIARVVSTRLKSAPLPLKLCYSQNIFRTCNDYSGHRSEIFQTGVEIVGGNQLKSDIECVICAMRSLEQINKYFDGKLTYKLEIGHVGFYKSLVSAFDLSKEEQELLHQYVDAKKSSFSGLFEDTENKANAIKILQQIPRLFGGSEVFGKARKLAGDNKEAISTLEYLNEIFSTLNQAGFGDFIAIDLAIAHSLEYYTGFVFRAYIEYAGEPVLSGGRYDSLLDRFDRKAPATGFGISLSLLSDIAAKLNLHKKPPVKSVLVHYEMPYLSEAEEYMENSRDLCELSCFDNLCDTLKYAKERGISEVVQLKAHGIAEVIKEV